MEELGCSFGCFCYRPAVRSTAQVICCPTSAWHSMTIHGTRWARHGTSVSCPQISAGSPRCPPGITSPRSGRSWTSRRSFEVWPCFLAEPGYADKKCLVAPAVRSVRTPLGEPLFISAPLCLVNHPTRAFLLTVKPSIVKPIIALSH